VRVPLPPLVATDGRPHRETQAVHWQAVASPAGRGEMFLLVSSWIDRLVCCCVLLLW